MADRPREALLNRVQPPLLVTGDGGRNAQEAAELPPVEILDLLELRPGHIQTILSNRGFFSPRPAGNPS